MILPAALALILAQGCSQAHAPGTASANAPGLGEDGQAHIRGVSDPNAPFTLIDRTKAHQEIPAEDPSSAPECGASSLQFYEAAASMNGADRTLRLALKNRGESACQLSGFPSIALLDDHGSAIASISVRQTGRSTVSGVVSAPANQPVSSTATPGVNVVLRPSGEASFEIRWSSGDDCPLVSRLAIGIAGTAEANAPLTNTFTINRPLKVCNGELRVTAFLSGSSV
jgi:hypothetical protein